MNNDSASDSDGGWVENAMPTPTMEHDDGEVGAQVQDLESESPFVVDRHAFSVGRITLG